MESIYTFERNLVLGLLFFLFTPFTILLSYTTLSIKVPTPQAQENPVRIFASLPEEYPSVSINLNTADARVPLVKSYLLRYGSPLAPFADKIVSEAEKNGLDYRLLIAIARQESNLCKFAPENTYNCWGWGIHKAGTLGFESYEEGIEVVSLGLKQGYIDKGLTTPEAIMSKYTPSSNGSWARGVQSFLDDIQ